MAALVLQVGECSRRAGGVRIRAGVWSVLSICCGWCFQFGAYGTLDSLLPQPNSLHRVGPTYNGTRPRTARLYGMVQASVTLGLRSPAVPALVNWPHHWGFNCTNQLLGTIGPQPSTPIR